MTGSTVIVLLAGIALMSVIWWPNSANSPTTLLLGSVVLSPMTMLDGRRQGGLV